MLLRLVLSAGLEATTRNIRVERVRFERRRHGCPVSTPASVTERRRQLDLNIQVLRVFPGEKLPH
jgi:hypothetical protein